MSCSLIVKSYMLRATRLLRAIYNRLAAELSAAEDRVRVADWRIRAITHAVLEAHAVAIAEAMLVEQAEMRRRRAQLGDLQLLLTNEGRWIFGDAVNPPAAISAAVVAADPPPAWKPSSPDGPRPADVPNPWTGRFEALIEDAEAEIG
jgi:hypothetical protein